MANQKANLMIVEDEAIVAEEIKTSLEGMGYFVTSIVKTGESAIEKAEQHRPDVILMDIRLEGQIDGIEAAERIRSRFGTTVIFLTAYADEDKLDRAKLALPFGYLIKPIQTRDLRVTIEMALFAAKADVKRKRAEEALQKAHDELERRVEERTAELVKSNEQLGREIEERKRAEEKLKESNKLLAALNRIQSQYISESTPRVLFDQLLNDLISLTESEYGFIGEVLYTAEGQPYLKTHAITDISWNKETREFYEKNAAAGMEFFNLKTLFGVVMSTGKPVIANDPATDPRRGGFPVGHPPLNAFLGLPCFCGEKLIGMVGVSNRPTGYDDTLIEYLDPFLKTCGNIIDSYRNVQLRLDSEEKLRESEARYRGLFEDSRDAIVLAKKERRIIDINQAGLDLFGYTKEELMRMNTLELYVYPDDRNRFQEEIKRKGYVRDYELTFCKKDKTAMDCLVTGTAKRADDGSIIGYQSFIRDITEYKELEKQFRQAQKMEAIGTLAGGIAHDFNNILTAVIGYTELTMGNIDKRSELHGNLEEVFKAGTRARDLVRQILAFSRQSDEELRPIMLSPIVKEALKLLRASLPSTVNIRQDIETDLPNVLADPTQIHQVVMNLCTNAAHAMEEKGGELKIGLSQVELDSDDLGPFADINPGQYLKFVVSDTGYGISPEDRELIFDPYFTTKKKGEGTGLGLSVVHGIVKSIGGNIAVESEPGKGATFKVYIPPVQRIPAPDETEEPEALPTGRERILFVDDEPTVADIGKKNLESLSYDVEVRTSSIEALKLLRAHPERFDLIVTDMTMPQMTGDKLAEELMKIRPDIPVILCTGFSKMISKEQAMRLGIKALVMKPFVIRDLAVTVRKVLDNGPARIPD